MAESSVAFALMWVLLVAFVTGLAVALAPYVHDAWTAQVAAVAGRVALLASLPLVPRPVAQVHPSHRKPRVAVTQ